MSSAQVIIRTNHLLAALPGNDYKKLLASGVETELVFAEVLYHAGNPISHVYFPTTSIISLITPIDNDRNLEIGLVGREGMFGLPLILAVDVASCNAVVQGAGQALRISTPIFLLQLQKSAAFNQKLKRYLFVVMSQIAQTAGCNFFHVIEARLARWLLMTQDRAQSDHFYATHASLANMLGVRRVGITKAAISLQKSELIIYKRGNIKILDRAGLEAASCACYRIEKEIYEKILG
ncbi:Crp/Fnr family transcriptional regulator [Nitrosomonas ureae]|uniref:cAMP-binding domain of CRP or a regulatory subunit of cAMP-dependent protein kinases n=1 Tax=Nitrosomonas ureae TaxID=44577 RepID=A0A0S3AKK1_9PROT|nr:Crp/Fnr family transcriptional regulator [Nitrosomonas ureae]ALQ51558.1 Crp/Fnr family transcriptional regulator [Nitrosomonas ureae]SDU20136.1 cAMP-binding domain of CRP or a regulatory subunit of cAMP-dependent protein kinases [Nitrosomonas ureae]SEQ10005.1 cAMP-binding domain of CRP or a regulatory subunit of cAMP-dependent protein kinases [Nitrosomonas ureae]